MSLVMEIRVTESDETEHLDKALHGEDAYGLVYERTHNSPKPIVEEEVETIGAI